MENGLNRLRMGSPKESSGGFDISRFDVESSVQSGGKWLLSCDGVGIASTERPFCKWIDRFMMEGVKEKQKKMTDKHTKQSRIM